MKEASRTVVCRRIDGSELEVPVSELTLRASAYGVVRKDGKILLTKEFGGYGIPGGGVDIGEPVREALIREIKEETGYDVSPGRMLHVEDDFFIHPARQTPHHSILLYYECEFLGGELTMDGLSEHERSWSEMPEWVTLEEAAKGHYTNPIESALMKRLANEA